MAASGRSEAEIGPLRERALAAARRALELDPGNAYGELARIRSRALRGRWVEVDQRLRRLLAGEPDNQFVLSLLGSFLCDVGRAVDALDIFARLSTRPITPNLYYRRIGALWGAGRMEELDRTIAEASELYPTQFAIWFSRFYIALFSGRPDQAIALGEDAANRPTGIPETEFDDILAVARAAKSRDPGEIEAAMATQSRRAHDGSGKAENAAQFACLFGRVDMAFAIFEAYYFDRGFTVPAVRFTTSQGSYLTRENRMTRLLFVPSTRPMRADPRFARLVGELGLEEYWRRTGVEPDYRRT
jgi:tetratricopeptide (TPR) repeat protein